LTLWYLAIIMFISILFSLVIYSGIDSELLRFERLHSLRIEKEQEGDSILPPLPRRLAKIDPEMIKETRNRLSFVLIIINLGILVISGGAAYFLAGRTLVPIKEMVEEQDRFITDASHELRTPLTSLRSEIEVNLRDKNLSLKGAKELLISNLEEVVNIQSLTDSLMELAQYQKKNGSYPFEELSLLKIIKKAQDKISAFAKTEHISLRNEARDFVFEGNKHSLTELIVILLDNAVKYSPKNTKVTIISGKNDHTITVSIKDEGMGINQKDLPFVFKRFYRADKARSKDKATGYGLGLAIAKKIVEVHNGKISVESKLNQGTVFHIQLPIRQHKNLF